MDASDLMTPAGLVRKYPRVASRSTLYCAMHSGLLPYIRLPSRRGARGKYLIAEKDFLAWLESHRHEAGASVPPPVVKPQPSRHLQL